MAEKLQLRMWQQMKQAQALECAGTPEADQYLCESRIYGAAADRITELERQVADLSIYKPCRRKDTPHVPVKAIGECNERYWFKGIQETDEEFSQRAGRKIEADPE